MLIALGALEPVCERLAGWKKHMVPNLYIDFDQESFRTCPISLCSFGALLTAKGSESLMGQSDNKNSESSHFQTAACLIVEINA
jgi:hypothetical protein